MFRLNCLQRSGQLLVSQLLQRQATPLIQNQHYWFAKKVISLDVNPKLMQQSQLKVNQITTETVHEVQTQKKVRKPRTSKSSQLQTKIKEDVAETKPIETPEKKTRKSRVIKTPQNEQETPVVEAPVQQNQVKVMNKAMVNKQNRDLLLSEHYTQKQLQLEAGMTLEDRCMALKEVFASHNFTDSILRKFFKLHEIKYRMPKSSQIQKDVAEPINTPEKKTPKTRVIKTPTKELEQPILIKKPVKVPKISLDEFWIEKEADEVKLHQISKKLVKDVSSEDKKRLNSQDLSDLKEIQSLIEIADIKAKQKPKPALDKLGLSLDDISQLPFETLNITSPKSYMKMERESSFGSIKLTLFVPPYDVDQIQQGIKRQYTIFISSKNKAKINQIFAAHDDIVTYIDGSCVGNPGLSGAGVAFFARETYSTLGHSETKSGSDSENEQSHEERLTYLFGCQLHLGFATNNYAEYMGLILAQLIHVLQESKQLTIRTDSQLLVQQVKGNSKVKNIRFVQMMPIVHDLAMHFERMNLDWIDREQNQFADKLARNAAFDSVGATQQQPDQFSLSFTIKKK